MPRKQMKSEQRELGRAVLTRLAEHGSAPPAMKPVIQAFKEEQRRLDAAADRAEAARSARDAALKNVAAADAILDGEVDVLANRLIGADFGPRRNPFAPFGEIPPTRLKQLGYALEVERVTKLLARVRARKPPATVARAVASCAAAASASGKALVAWVGPQAAFVAALSARDALLPQWTRAFDRLRLQAKLAWSDDPGLYRAIFAPPGLDVPRTRRRRGKTQAPLPSRSASPAAAPTAT